MKGHHYSPLVVIGRKTANLIFLHEHIETLITWISSLDKTMSMKTHNHVSFMYFSTLWQANVHLMSFKFRGFWTAN